MSSPPGSPRVTVFRSTIPFEHARIGAAAIYCSDGRYGDQFDEFLHKHLGLPRYDRVAIPGGPASLAGHFDAYRDEAALIPQLEFLISTHTLEHVVLIAHEQCGFYLRRLGMAAAEVAAQQEADLRKAADRLWSLRPGLVVSGFMAERAAGGVTFRPVGLSPG